MENQLRRMASANKTVLVTEACQAGKPTLLKEIFPEYKYPRSR